MSTLTDDSGIALIDNAGQVLTTDGTEDGGVVGGGLIVFTTMMVFLLMIFGGYNAPS